MVCFQEGENDEDMTRMDTNIIRTCLGRDMDDEYVICLCTTIRAKDKVSLFLCYLLTYFENRLLPKNIIIIRNHGDDDGVLKDRHGGGEDQQGVAEPLELFRLKCASHRYTADTNSTHF
jgi:hypothetical protein